MTPVPTDPIAALRTALRTALKQWQMYADAERGPGPEHFDNSEPNADYLTWITDGTDAEAEQFKACLAALATSQADDPSGPDDLGAAWAEAEAALPEGWWFEVYRNGRKEGDINPHTGTMLGPLPGPYVATAQPVWYPLGGGDGPNDVLRDGLTPAAALRALAAALRESPDGE